MMGRGHAYAFEIFAGLPIVPCFTNPGASIMVKEKTVKREGKKAPASTKKEKKAAKAAKRAK